MLYVGNRSPSHRPECTVYFMSILRFPRMFSTLLSNRHWQGGEKVQSVRKALTMEVDDNKHFIWRCLHCQQKIAKSEFSNQRPSLPVPH